MSARDCPYCDGRGCSECDGKGQRYGELHDVGDGMTLHVSGSGDGASPELVEALTTLAKAAFARMDDQSSEQSANKPASAATNQTPARESDA